ncbi:iron complex outermembrane recepter protein [Solimonas aquatica]|uniref:Iron complex outermembrane recepter protein n=1 Tax=Solimonas aquatica TaxID=489703 RepID=A0A1H9H927_9GAMM|nr:TonB-dependent receptor [Solimonas aquatica]SEQ58825.1 iron complex outermembrane recepter protein [Solimonas aquatica]
MPALAQSPDAPAEALPTIPVAGEPAAAPSTAAPREESGALAEVIVTARKREERLQDVPVSVQAFSSEQLDARGVQSIRDLAEAVPGMQVTDLGGYNLIYLRGVGTDVFIPSAEPSIATYVDGVYFPSGHSLAQAFGAVERVEVLKGPQGTLFGRNSTGGAVSVWSKNPGQTPETSVQLSYGNYKDAQARVYTNLPLSNALAVSLSGFYNRRDSYYRVDNGSNEQLPPEIGRGGRLKIGVEFSEDLNLVVTGIYARQSGTSTTVSANVNPTPLLGITLPAEIRDYVTTANSEPSLSTITRALYGQLNWHLSGVDTKLLGSYYFVKAFDYVYDFDGTSQPIATYGADDEYQRFVTSELQFTSNADSWGSSWLKWVGGLYYLRSDGGYKPGYLRLLDAVQLPTTEQIGALPLGLGDLVLSLLGNSPIPQDLTFYFTGLLKTEAYSGYAQATASLTSWLDLTLGGRWQRESRKLVTSDVSDGNLNGGLTRLYSFPQEESTARNFSPKVSLDWRPAQDLLIYASFQQGFKSGTYNIINIFKAPTYVEPEKVTAYEVGLKSEWFNHSLRFNTALFENDIHNLQTGFMSFTSGGAINLENAGKARIRGLEVEALWQPLPELDPGLLLGGNLSWLHAVYLDYDDGRGFGELTGLAYKSDCSNPGSPACHPFSGNQIVRTPKLSSTLTLSQSFELGQGTLELAGDWYTNSGYYYLAQNTPDTFEPAYQIFNAHLSYLYQPYGLKLTVYGDNLGDERYNLAQFHTDFGREDSLAPPRTWGLRLNWDF